MELVPNLNSNASTKSTIIILIKKQLYWGILWCVRPPELVGFRMFNLLESKVRSLIKLVVVMKNGKCCY